MSRWQGGRRGFRQSDIAPWFSSWSYCYSLKCQRSHFNGHRFSSFSRVHMQTPMKPCPLRMPDVDPPAPSVRKGPLTGRSGPAFQAVGSVIHLVRERALLVHKWSFSPSGLLDRHAGLQLPSHKLLWGDCAAGLWQVPPWRRTVNRLEWKPRGFAGIYGSGESLCTHASHRRHFAATGQVLFLRPTVVSRAL